jgi:hypothetical protein
MKRSKQETVMTCSVSPITLPLTWLCVVALSLISATSRAAELDFVKMIPQDRAGVIVIKDWGKLVKLDDRSPIGRLINHPAIKHTAFGAMLTAIPSPADIEKAIGLDEAAALRLLKGKAAVSLHLNSDSLNLALDDEENSDAAPWYDDVIEAVAFLEFAGNPAEHEKILNGMKQLAQDRGTLFDYASEATDGALMTTITLTDENEKEVTYYEALVSGVIVLAHKKESLSDGIKAVRAGVIDDNFAAHPTYLQAVAEMGSEDGFAILNLESASDKVRALGEKALRKQISESPQSGLFLDPKTVMDAINLEDLRALYGSFQLDEKRAVINYGLTWKDKIGLTSLIQFGPDPVAMPDFVTTDFKGASIYSLDPAKSWDAIRSLLQKLSPGGWTMVTGMMAASDPTLMPALEAVHKDLVLNLEAEVIDLVGFPNRQPNDDTRPSMITIFKLKNPDNVTKTIESTIAVLDKQERLPQPSKRDYLGSTIITYDINSHVDDQVEVDPDGATVEDPTVQQDSRGLGISYAVVGNYLIIGAAQPGFVESVIANFQTPGRPLEKSGVFNEIGAAQGIPVGLGYIDVATYLRMAINEAMPFAYEGQDDDDLLSKDNLLKQRASLKDLHFNYSSKTFVAENGLHVKSLIVESQE